MARTPKAGNPPSPQDDKPVKLTITLPAELAKRLGVHAEMMGTGKSELLAELIRTGCRRFVVHDHGKRPGEAETDAA